MKIGDIDLYALPKWMNAVFEHVEHQCEGELMHESEIYRRIIEEEKNLLERYPLLSVLSAGDETPHSVELTAEELKAISRFMALEDDRREMESLKYYLMGARGLMEILDLIRST